MGSKKSNIYLDPLAAARERVITSLRAMQDQLLADTLAEIERAKKEGRNPRYPQLCMLVTRDGNH